jgi:hypothetical protein
MSVIAISRGSFSGGKLLAEALARRLNYRCIDRDVVIQRTSIRSISPSELFDALDPPPTSELYSLNHRRYIYLALVQAAILEEVYAGNAVYHGLAGHLLLPDELHVLRIRVIAPMEYRIRVARERLHLDEHQAVAHIKKVDDHRGKWTRYLYGVNWEDPALYDLVFNLQHVSVEQACQLIYGMVKLGGFEFSPKQRAAMNDFLITTRVLGALAKDPLTSNLEVEVVSSGGQVTIKGELLDQTEDLRRVAAAVQDVRSVSLEEVQSPKETSPAVSSDGNGV